MYKIITLVLAICSVLLANAYDKPHVVLFGIDGFTVDGLIESDMPNVKSEMNRGAWSLTKRSVNPSLSAPNWASMFMGVPTEIHGYTQWGSQSPEIPQNMDQKNILPTIFQLLKEDDKNIKTACIYEWEGIKWLIDTISVDYFELASDYLQQPCTQLTNMAVNKLRLDRPDLFCVIFDWAHHIGHAQGFKSEGYKDALSLIDESIGRIIQSLKEIGYYDSSTFIITGDHGGINISHGGISLDEMESPFIISGNKIGNCGEFNELMMQYDIAATLADIFGITPPMIWRGKSFLDVFGTGSKDLVKNLSAVGNPLRKTYFDIDGFHLNNEPAKGMYLVTETYSDGTRITKKMIH